MNEGDVAVILDGYDSVEVLNVAEVDLSKEWILDSRIKHYDGIERVLEDVRYIPKLKRNLISLGMLDKSGYTFKTDMIDKVSTVLKEDVGITSYGIRGLVTSATGTTRVGEARSAGKLQADRFAFCEHCVFRKATRVKFSKTVHETQNQLDYLHSDLWVLLIGGTSYTRGDGFLRKNETWELVTKPKDQKLVGSKWVFKRKQGTLGDEAPSSIRLLLAFVAHEDLELDQLDVKTTFLHGELDELIYMQPHEGFGKESRMVRYVYLRNLFMAKQSPRQWYKRFDKYMLDIGFNRSSHDGCVYFKLNEDIMVYLLLYVDDMRVACKERRHLEQVKEMLKAEFEMKDLGSAKRILGMEIERDRSKRVLRLSQKSYIQAWWECDVTMVCSRPDLTYALQGFVDADYAGNIDTRKSLTGYVFTVFGGAVSWKANLQSVVALSTTKAKYMAMIEAMKEAI
ncbi:Retrovirus-related Pol polyprotein from transposon TNT 1-94 [Vitis vinifera]|uniref:Retrovirus-related Pol polyprotein from transposon TNT 1-94 n=1 Tax=Vitis vinifera TaxID=29760 RepID=A0A438FWY7_VITVI|nr:Retrovirus-related Pol polyprotein from transposon TNT 1-94 [Vitis vinifera]